MTYLKENTNWVIKVKVLLRHGRSVNNPDRKITLLNCLGWKITILTSSLVSVWSVDFRTVKLRDGFCTERRQEC